MDLTLLPHLSDEALAREAQSRGVDPSGVPREALIEAIRKAPGPKRAERAESPPDAPPPDPGEEPIQTKTLALLLLDQGDDERALAMLEALRAEATSVDPELEAARRQAFSQVARARAQQRARHMGAAGASQVELRRDELGCEVQWRIEARGEDGARALLPGREAERTLRVVTVVAHGNRATDVRPLAQSAVPASGGTWLEVDPRARLVVAIGLAAGEDFAAIAHATDDRYAPARD